MRKILLLAMALLAASSAEAQWRMAPTVAIGTNEHSYDAPFPPTDASGTTYRVGFEMIYGADDDNFLGFLVGTSLQHTHSKTDAGGRSFTSLPIYAMARLNIGVVFEAGLGYHIPLGSVGRGYMTGWSIPFGAGMLLHKVYLGIRVDAGGLFVKRELWYVPDGWVRTSSNLDLMFQMQYVIPVKK